MNSEKKISFINPLISALALLVVFIVLELATRVIKGEYAFVNFAEQNINILKSSYPCQYDSHLGWIPQEGYSGDKNSWGKTVTILKNGIRSNGTGKAEEASGPVSILAVGDSFTFGADVSDGETWPALLEKISGKRVVNGGVFAYGLDQIFLRAGQLVRVYNPDILILSFIADDVLRCRQSKRHGVAKPYIELSGDRLVTKNIPVPILPAEKDGLWLARKIFGYSAFLHYAMKTAFPDHWLQEKWGDDEAYSQDQAVSTGYLMFRYLRAMIPTDRLKHIIVLVQYTHDTNLDELSIVDAVLSGIDDKTIQVVDLAVPFFGIIKTNPEVLDAFFYGRRGHMTLEGNNFVAHQLHKALSEAGVL
ncbi:MAG TPA: hypothetical protein PLO78_03330 [Candidatus Omnitrophota bacterium]|nr:hypothetical protein [Candidatus Omnitrophota bacterium]